MASLYTLASSLNAVDAAFSFTIFSLSILIFLFSYSICVLVASSASAAATFKGFSFFIFFNFLSLISNYLKATLALNSLTIFNFSAGVSLTAFFLSSFASLAALAAVS